MFYYKIEEYGENPVRHYLPATEPPLSIEEWAEQFRDRFCDEPAIYAIEAFTYCNEAGVAIIKDEVVIRLGNDDSRPGETSFDRGVIRQAVEAIASARNNSSVSKL